MRAALKPGEDSVKAVIVSDQVEAPCPPDFASLGGLKRKPEDIVLLQHSTGTTGLQKGVGRHKPVDGLWNCYTIERFGCVRFLASTVSRYGTDRVLVDADPAGVSVGDHVAI